MKKWLLLILLLPITCLAQTYKYIEVEDGLSNRRVYCIQKDKKGYMWFLTHEGIDRYNGKEFKQYKLQDDGEEVNSLLNLNWLYVDKNGVLWQIGKRGKIFRYDIMYDAFILTYKLPETPIKGNPTTITYGYIDDTNNIWLCGLDTIHMYNTQTKKHTLVKNAIHKSITDIAQIDATHFFIGTEVGIHYAELRNGILQRIPCNELDSMSIQINKLYFDPKVRKLFMGTFQRGVFVYDMNAKTNNQLKISLTDISINTIKKFNDNELLIATDGAGVFRINKHTYQTTPYIVADYNKYNSMNGNSINDLYVDSENRIWMANYPIGITVRNNRYSSYNWIKHSIGNKESLINDQVNSIIEDSEGDLWFATNNGVSLYNTQTKKWHSFFSSFEIVSKDKNHIFFTLCEVSPGLIWVGGYSSGILEINKKSLQTNLFTPTSLSHENIRPDKYIRTISKDSKGNIWSGGYYNLKKTNLAKRSIRLYNGLNSITTIQEKDSTHMWIGTATGLFLLNTENGKYERIKLPVESIYIYSLFQTKNGSLYIGTSGSGFLIYDSKKKLFTHYHKDNCAIISNNIYTILSNNDQEMAISTESGLAYFNIKEKIFQNWTQEQGLMTVHFNAESGTLLKNNNFIFGSSNGAVEFNKDMRLQKTYSTQMVFSDFRLFYQTVYPGEKNSPLTTNIDDTQHLKLKNKQSIFSLKVSSINYDYPSNILYSWKLEGFYDKWSTPESDNIIHFTNLNPGEYVLRVRAISNENKRSILEERSMKITIEHPIWLSLWAVLLYTICIMLLAVIVMRIIILKKQRKISDEKIHFFVNTAHDIRTPLTLIKAPLEEIREKEHFSENGTANMNTALRNVNALLRLTTNLINFERTDVFSSELYISEYELNTYMQKVYNTFQPYASIKRIHFTLECNFHYDNAWFDQDKMDSILKNIISNALKYTHELGSVHISTTVNDTTWSVEVKDTGIGIPANEQKKLFKIHFRGSNVINSKITGSGIGLMLVWRLVQLHKGKIQFTSIENQGSLVKITFPKDNKKFKKAHLKIKDQIVVSDGQIYEAIPTIYKKVQKDGDEKRQRVMVVEDNDDLRNYLQHTLSEEYTVQSYNNGREGLNMVKEYMPELIISDIMMPEMRGDELCAIIKNDIETSHIPIILLTALNDERNILEGIKIGADDYIVKPFNIGILKATINNLLTNRALLRNKYRNLEIKDEDECTNCSSDLDWKFIATVKKCVEENMDNQAFNVDVLCNLMNMSRTSFYNKLRALTDQAPADYIRLIRLKRAAFLLKAGQNSISEIAEMTGFNDAKYFREVFKKHFKVSPTKYSKGETEEQTKEKEEK